MYSIILQEPAKRIIKKLDRNEQRRIINKIEKLKDNPKLGKPLTANLSGLWSLRVWKYRIIYKIDHNRVTVFVLDVEHRKKVY